jgi:Orthopoxvirus protein of unknown function (DUF830).
MEIEDKHNMPHNLAGCMIFFVDKKSRGKLGPKTGCNQTGIFISDSEIMFVRKRKVQNINVDELKGTKVVIHKVKDDPLSRNIVAFCKNIKNNYRMFGLGIRALVNHNFEVFDSENIMPNFYNYLSITQYDIAWSELTSKLRKGDLIFTFNKKSRISKLIASIDNGSWSHCAIYMGQGNIFEAISKGRVVRNIEVYKNPNTHIGVYRSGVGKQSLTNDTINKFVNGEAGPGYGYLKAILLGMRTVLVLNDDKFSPTDVTPNGLIYSGSFYLVDYL